MLFFNYSLLKQVNNYNQVLKVEVKFIGFLIRYERKTYIKIQPGWLPRKSILNVKNVSLLYLLFLLFSSIITHFRKRLFIPSKRSKLSHSFKMHSVVEQCSR